MRILIVSELFPPEFIGGYELVAHELALRLSKAGHQVAVATSPLVNHTRDPDEPGFAIYRTLQCTWVSLHGGEDQRFKIKFVNLNNIFAISSIVEEFKPDRLFLFSLSGLGAYGIVLFGYLVGLRPMVYLGDNIFMVSDSDTAALRDKYYDVFRAREAMASLRILAVSENVYLETKTAIATPIQEPVYVPGWVEDTIPPHRRSSSETMRFVFSSRVTPHKGTDILIDAVRILVERGDRNFQVDVYGGGLAPQFIQRVHAEGLSAYINYVGLVERDEMVRRFAEYDALVFPTWQREPLGLVPFEAAAQGCIPIVTAQTGACEWLTEGECIKIERSGFGLAGGMQLIMHMSGDERAAMQARACRNVRRYFGASRWFPRIERLISEPSNAVRTMTPRMARDVMFTITRAWNP